MNQNQQNNSSDDVIQFEDDEIIDFINIESNTPKICQLQNQELKVSNQQKISSQLIVIQQQINQSKIKANKIQLKTLQVKIDDQKNNNTSELQKFKDNNYTVLLDLQVEFDVEQFLIHPAPKGGMIQQQYNKIILNSEKKSFSIKGSYKIFAKGKKEQFLGKIKGDFMGQKYIIYDNGKTSKKSKDINQLRKELGVIYYQPYERNYFQFRYLFLQQLLLDNYMNLRTIHSIILLSIILIMWLNQQIENLNGQLHINLTVQIFMNFILTQRGSDIPVLLFGKNDDREFVVDFSYPLTPVQAFCIALSSMDHKFGCK